MTYGTSTGAAGGAASGNRVGFSRGLSPVVMALLGALLLVRVVDLPRLTAPQRPPTYYDFTPPETARTRPPFDVSLVIDQSSSLAGSDHDDSRLDAVRAFMRWVGDFGDADDSITIQQFADRSAASPTIGSTGITPATIAAATALADVGGGTNFAAATTTVAKIVANQQHPAVVFLTDGDPSEGTVRGAMARIPVGVAVYVLGYDGDGLWSANRAAWRPYLRDSWTIRHFAPKDVSMTVARLIVALTGQKVGVRERRQP